jgi:hypothetical protein
MRGRSDVAYIERGYDQAETSIECVARRHRSRRYGLERKERLAHRKIEIEVGRLAGKSQSKEKI